MSDEAGLLHVLRHALGRDEHGRRPPGKTADHRGHFCAAEGSNDFALCEGAVELGFMTRRAPSAYSGGGWIYVVTLAGVAHVDAESPAPPVLSAGARRYREWLSGPADFMGFGEWLKRRT